MLEFYKTDENNKIWDVIDTERRGPLLFSFDKKKIYNMWADYPDKLTPEQKELFDKENPYWANCFKDRCVNA